METKAQEIFKKQLIKLPAEVTSFLTSADWDHDLDEICKSSNLSEDEIFGFKREVTLVLVGLVHPDGLIITLEQEVNIQGEILEKIVREVEEKILAPIRTPLLEFFKNEGGGVMNNKQSIMNNGGETPQSSDTSLQGETGIKIPLREMVAPVGDEAVIPEFSPLLSPPYQLPASPAHPFEEKMKKVFTAGSQNMGDFVLEPPVPQPPSRDTLKSGNDPYREEI